MKKIRVFLASSNDMKKHREATALIINELNKTLEEHFDLQLDLFRWEKQAHPQMGRPQLIIFEQSLFNDIDIFIGIIGTRFGTPTGKDDDMGNPYGSGTQEEYDAAYKLYLKTKKPHIMIFKNDAPITHSDLDIEQYKKVLDFFKEFDADKSHPGLYLSFKSISDFKSIIRIELLNAVIKHFIAKPKPDELSSDSLKQYGLEKIFFPQTNSNRSIIKSDAIKGSSFVYLIGKTGNSFLGKIGNRYSDLLVENTQYHNGIVRVLLQNPWSYSAIQTALCESISTDNYLSFLKHSMSSQDVISLYQNTDWFRVKLNDVLTGYQLIMDKYPEIELRFIDTEIYASILLTDSSCFYESYSGFCESDRINKKVATFEVQFNNTSELYKSSLNHFNMLWDIAMPYEELQQNQSHYKNKLAMHIDALYAKNTFFYIGVHALIKNKDRFLILHRNNDKTYMPGLWDIPGGSLESGETLYDALLREISEETGIVIKIGDLLHAYSNMSELPYRQTLQLIYAAKYVEGDVDLRLNEHQDYKWVSIEEAMEMDLADFLKDYLESIQA